MQYTYKGGVAPYVICFSPALNVVAYTFDDEHSLYALFAKELQSRWNVEDEGDVHDLLGIEFRFEGKTVTLHQNAYRLGWLGTRLTLASHFPRRAWSRAQLSHRDPHWIGPDIIPGGVLLLFFTPLRLQSN